MLTLKSSKNFKPSIFSSNMSITSLSNVRPIIKLFGRFLELKPNINNELSFFLHKYSFKKINRINNNRILIN